MSRYFLLLLLATSAGAAVDVSDAPASYGNAAHTLVSGWRLGDLVDADTGALASPNATGDDANGSDDEDGMTVRSEPLGAVIPWQRGMHSEVRVSVGLPEGVTEGKLNVWADWNRDGNFGAGEAIIVNRPVIAGTNPFGIEVPVAAGLGNTILRFRLTNAGIASPNGLAAEGEVEDYVITIVEPSAAASVQAYQRDGQVWVTWDYDLLRAPQVYEVYRSTNAAWTNVNQGQLVAQLFPEDYSALHHSREWRDAFGAATANTNFTIPHPVAGSAPVTLASNKGLCVATVRVDGNFSWAVVPRGVTTIGAAKTPLLAQTFSTAEPPKAHQQQKGIVGGYDVTFYSLWSDGGDLIEAPRPDFPFMGNHNRNGDATLFFTVERAGGAEPNSHATIAMHSGDASAQMWLPGTPGWTNAGMDPGDGTLIALEDNLHLLVNGGVESSTTRWLGYAPEFDATSNVTSFPFAPAALIAANPLPAATSVVQPYTQNRINWTLSWIIANRGLASNQISLIGHSGGAKGAMLWSHTYPEKFASTVLFAPAIGDTSLNTTLQPMLGTPAMNLATTLTLLSGTTVRMNETVSLTTSLCDKRDLPPTRIYFGQMEGNWATDDNADLKSDVIEAAKDADALGIGVAFHWDQRLHGVNEWTLADVTSRFPVCTWSNNDFFIPTVAQQARRDDAIYRSRYFSDQSYPAFFNCRNYANHSDIGAVNYGGILYSEHQQWTGPADPCQPKYPAHTGDRKGTFGGYFDWTTYPAANGTILDTPSQWAALLFIQAFDGDEATISRSESCPVDELQADVAIRRPQLFKPTPGTNLTWVNYNFETGKVIQHGFAGFDFTDVVTVPGVTVRKQTLAYSRLVVASQMDFGDAPTCYPVHGFRDGARHLQDGSLRLGASISLEAEGATSGTASIEGSTDDGVTLPSTFVPGASAPIGLQASVEGKVDAWIDWNADGDWLDQGEQILTAAPVSAGSNQVSIAVPSNAIAGKTFARFRLSSGGGLAPTGAAPNGEVEDYQVNVAQPPSSSVIPVVSHQPNDRVEYTTDSSGSSVIQWLGRPTEQVTVQVSEDLTAWKTWFISGATETQGIVSIPSPDPGWLRCFCRLVRTPLVTSPIPCVPGPHYKLSFVHAGRTRTYSLYLPTTVMATPVPLALILHGGDQTALSFIEQRGSELFAQAELQRMILCFPDACEREARGTGWYRYDEIAGRPYIDDQAFLDALVAHLLTVLSVDTHRLYLAGFSDGGQMVHYMGASSSTHFAASAVCGSAIGGGVVLGQPIVLAPTPSAPQPMLIINTKDDPVRPYDGSAEATPALAQATHWASANGCSQPILATISTTTGVTPHTLTIDEFACQLAPVRFVTLETGGHQWPDAADSLGYDANTEVLNWLTGHISP